MSKIAKVKKRYGTIVDFDSKKILNSIRKASHEVGLRHDIASKLLPSIENLIFRKYKGRIPAVENIQDIVEDVLINHGYLKVAKAYILYREKRRELKTSYFGVKDDLKLSLNAIKVLQERYLLKDEFGNIIETPLEMFRRVANAIAKIDLAYNGNAHLIEEEFFKVMSNLEFLPNSPCLMNAGTSVKQLNACFVIPINDSLDEIYESLKISALIQKTGGGTGFSFSKLRPKNNLVVSTKGRASGPVSFMSLFDKSTDIIKLGGKRRGANMAILKCDHPDILEFIKCKSDGGFSNFNISVSVTDEFMKAVLKNKDYELKFGSVIKKVNARNIFDNIINESWKTGDPGLIFIDEINRKHSLYAQINSTNPCGEQPLLDWESCILGSINLSKFVHNKKIEWDRLKKIVRLGVHFLDNVIDANHYLTKDIEAVTLSNRKIGLGVMGWADMLIKLGVKYDSNEALKLAEKLMKFISSEAVNMSIELGKKRGSFPNFKRSKLKDKYDYMRNATVTTIAPTGTISLIANCSSSIEPLFAISYTKEILDSKFIEINSLFEETAKKCGFYFEELMYEIARNGIKNVREVPKEIKKLFVTSMDINYEWHLKMQSAFQRYTDNAVSKTINLPENASKEDVKKAYLLAYKLKCKGITVFRYGSKDKQVLYLENKCLDCGN